MTLPAPGPTWYFILSGNDTTPTDYNGFAAISGLGPVGQMVMAVLRSNLLTIGQGSFLPWGDLDNLTHHINWDIGPSFVVMGLVCLVLAFANFPGIIQLCGIKRRATADNPIPTTDPEQKEIDDFKESTRIIMFVMAVAAVFSSVWLIVYLLAWKGTSVAAHAFRNNTLMSILAVGFAFFTLAMVWVVFGITLSPRRHIAAIIHPNVAREVRRACTFVIFWMAWMTTSGAGYSSDTPHYVAMILCMGLFLMPPLSATFFLSSDDAPSSFVDQWLYMRYENVIYYLVQATVFFLLAVPAQSYNPYFLSLSDDTNPGMYAVSWVILLIPIVALLYLAISLFVWHARDPLLRELDGYQAKVLQKGYNAEKYAAERKKREEQLQEMQHNPVFQSLSAMSGAAGRRNPASAPHTRSNSSSSNKKSTKSSKKSPSTKEEKPKKTKSSSSTDKKPSKSSIKFSATY